ncbi:hypothetical protein KIPB_009964 [Kipferlia bialata]|uniref:Uncharacterized protein n=1 Tax=Kipferlia bialata TaxID=797122 RepID=A0A9K3D2F7_9EUKA|nr:hypothetical protein KIPB_009964 [Kipferlia bialata]|eukprot:g9964.t1
MAAQGIAVDNPAIELDDTDSPGSALTVSTLSHIANCILRYNPHSSPVILEIQSYQYSMPRTLEHRTSGSVECVTHLKGVKRKGLVTLPVPAFSALFPAHGSASGRDIKEFQSVSGYSCKPSSMPHFKDAFQTQASLLLSLIAREVIQGRIAPYRLVAIAMLLSGCSARGYNPVAAEDAATYGLLNAGLPAVRAFLSLGPEPFTPCLYTVSDHKACLALSAWARGVGGLSDMRVYTPDKLSKTLASTLKGRKKAEVLLGKVPLLWSRF